LLIPIATNGAAAERRKYAPGEGEKTRIVSVEQELPVAREAYISCEQAVRETLNGLRIGDELDTKTLTGAVRSITDSIQRNPDAMMLLNALHAKGNYELGRAMDTSVLMTTFARFLQLPRGGLEVMGLAGMLLDVGKTSIPDGVLKKKDVLTSAYDRVKAHVLHSVELIRKTSGLPAQIEDRAPPSRTSGRERLPEGTARRRNIPVGTTAPSPQLVWKSHLRRSHTALVQERRLVNAESTAC
jgi:HD-GYP domain-containing protein (c-di-GMP phosphodiesterase class II)